MAMVRRDYQKKGVTRSLINLVREKVRAPPNNIPSTFSFAFRLKRQEERLHVHRPVMKTYVSASLVAPNTTDNTMIRFLFIVP